MDDIEQLLKSNKNFKQNVLSVTQEFTDLRKEFLEKFPDLSIDREQTEKTTSRFESFTEELIQKYTINQQPAITVCGPNSSGKTAFVQHFLQIGDILPSDVGPVTTRILKLTYAPANKAYAHIFSSLQDRLKKKDPKIVVPLDEFFVNRDPSESEDLSDQLLEHMKRPEDLEGEEFAQWSKHFIELGLPSPTLELGIDVYDTPGFLSNGRDEILNDNLYELIKSVQPVLLFLYVNPAVSATDQACFLSLKQALGALDNVPIFFLNTQADPIVILKNEKVNTKREVSEEKFKEVLHISREKRYKLLLEHDVITGEVIGGLPESIDDCDCFDICTVPNEMSLFSEYAYLINDNTFRRIIQFAVRADGNACQSLADRALSSIDEYFDIAFSTTYGSADQWNQLRDESIQWANRFFNNIREALPNIINTIQESILNLFDKQKEAIAIRAGNLIRDDIQIGMKLPPSAYRVRDFVKTAVYEEVLKVAASESMKASLADIDEICNDRLLKSKKKNELLSIAKRHIQFWEISGEDLNQRSFFAAILEHLVKVPEAVARIVTTIRTRFYLDWYKEHANQYEVFDSLDRSAQLTNEKKRQEYAREHLVKARESIAGQKPLFERNVFEWIETKEKEFYDRIEKCHQYAIQHMKDRERARRLTEMYSERFAKFECQLIAAKDLSKFNGIKPVVFENQLIGAGGYFNVNVGKWGDRENLAVKSQNVFTKHEEPYAAYIEAHFHRAITNTRQANIVPLLHLYYENDQLYIFMPRYRESLQSYLQKNIKTIKLDKVLSFALIIANILNDIHENDFVHRDIKSGNVLLDENDQCHLIDFGTAGKELRSRLFAGTPPFSPELYEALKPQNENSEMIYDGKANDIFCYGVFLYELLPKEEFCRPLQDEIEIPESLFKNGRNALPADMDSYKQLVLDCLQHNPEERPDASKIVQRLEELVRKCEVRRCVGCLVRERTVRTLPCGHKVLCQQCRRDLRARNYHLCVMCKKLMRQDVIDDNN